MERISTLMTKVLKRRGLNNVTLATNIVQHAQGWVSTNIPGHSQDLSVKSLIDGTLTVEAGNSIAAQECHQKTSALLKFLADREAALPVDQVRIVRDL